MAKSRKSLSCWMSCDKCGSLLTNKDLPSHEADCPPSNYDWKHSYIREGALYGALEIYAALDELKHVSEREANNMIFMSRSAMELCNIPIGDPVVISSKEGTIVKIAWPTNDKTLTSVSMTKKAMESSRFHGQVKVEKLPREPCTAREIEIVYVGKQPQPKITSEIMVVIKNSTESKIFCVGNRISVPYYGKSLVFKIVAVAKCETNVASSRSKDLCEAMKEIDISDGESNGVQFYKALYCTKWRVASVAEEENVVRKEKLTIDDIGGYGTLIDDLRDVLDVALGKWKRIKGFKVARGILLYGTAGVGKSIVANAVISEYSAETFPINSWEIQSKVAGETEVRLSDVFAEAKSRAPSIILIEDIDILCPRKSGSSQENEKRVYGALVKLLDELHALDANVVVLATTSRPDFVDSSLRRPGRLDKELEVCAPTPQMRKAILSKFLGKVPNSLSQEDVDHIALTTHGFVGADLYGLSSEAAMHAMKRHRDRVRKDRSDESDIVVEMEDFRHALTIAKPSAMKEVVVEVPNVKWTEIGGQQGLKLKLKQAVEWPLTHPEAFVRLGISPPRGLLMFGPPGCSKTMIAKALATETKLNFLNIKGPELFSKWVGESERAVRQVFRKARQVAPSIIFIDEIDALGGERGSSSNSNGSNVQERVLAQLLTELDGITALGNVTLVAATNRPDRIDKALLRPGRLDRIVYVPLPDAETRQEIFAIKFRKMLVAQDVIVQDLVDLTEGYSGAEVQAICHEAAMKALEEDIDAKIITKEHFKAALSIVTPRTPASLIQLYEDYINNYK